MLSSQPPLTVPADLSNCDREPIHIPGAIQPHGVLLCLDGESGRVLQVSENSESILGREPAAVLRSHIDEVLHEGFFELLTSRLAGPEAEINPLDIDVHRAGNLQRFDAIAHRVDDTIVVELEPAQTPLRGELEAFFSHVRSAVARLQAAPSVARVCAITAEEFARIAAFDRTMVYRFDADWNGEVVAEVRVPELAPFLGLHFPATDIPRQARELYRRNMLRLIPNAAYRPARVIPEINPLTERQLDMSACVLRSVSPIHLEYLANMGVTGSMSVSLLKHGELWGLVAVHHRTARYVPYRVRIALELLGRTAALQITTLEETRDFEHRIRLRALQTAVVESVTREGEFADAVARSELLEIANAPGAVVKTDGVPVLIGRTPPLRGIRRILAWLDERGVTDRDEPFVTDALPLVNPEFEEYKDDASGLLAVPLTTTRGGWLLWFRPEAVRTVTWGGDPSKPAARDGERVSPRKSFESWKETVRLHAAHWEGAEIDAAVDLRRLLSDVMMRRAREYAQLNAELARSNAELESFAYVASHDLKEPLRGIHHFAQFLQRDYGSGFDERGQETIGTILRLADRMQAQIESLLRYARVGEEEVAQHATDLDVALDEALELLGPRLRENDVEVRRPERLPAVLFAAPYAREVFVNLIGNAVKYNERPHKLVEIRVDSAGGPTGRPASETAGPPASNMVTIAVRDNGIGIRGRHLESVFRMFRRLHAREAYGGGTGAGLAIARKIVERNGGSMWVESVEGEGSTFFFTVPVSEE